MIELTIAWLLLIVAVFSGKAEWYIASGVFAVAGNINRLKGE